MKLHCGDICDGFALLFCLRSSIHTSNWINTRDQAWIAVNASSSETPSKISRLGYLKICPMPTKHGRMVLSLGSVLSFGGAAGIQDAVKPASVKFVRVAVTHINLGPFIFDWFVHPSLKVCISHFAEMIASKCVPPARILFNPAMLAATVELSAAVPARPLPVPCGRLHAVAVSPRP